MRSLLLPVVLLLVGATPAPREAAAAATRRTDTRPGREAGAAEGRPASAPADDHGAKDDLPCSSGEYLGHKWHIDRNHLMWWDGKPYVRFGFTGNGDPEQMRQLGFDQFHLMPAEQWAISGPNEAIPRGMDETTDRLEKMGATYYGGLNAFWPWRYGNLIGDADKATVFVRDVIDVSNMAGRRQPLDVTVRMPIPTAEQGKVKVLRTEAVLFDMQEGTRRELSTKIERVDRAPARSVGRRAQPGPPNDDASGGVRLYRVRLGAVAFPQSQPLRLVVGMELLCDEVPQVNGLPPLWKPGIRQYYRRSLNAFRRSYAKPGLRGMLFGDEINAFPVSLLTSRAYWDIRRDALALSSYRQWLARRLSSIDRLNGLLGTRYGSFDEVEWVVPLHPFTPELLRRHDSDAAASEDPWSRLTSTFGLFDTVGQFRTVGDLQDEFRMWFYGHWLAEYAREAKEVIGNVPVFVCSASIPGEADRYLAVHRWALRGGVDGLTRNHYGGYLGGEERAALASVSRWIGRVQAEAGRTKHLWANEIGYVHVRDAETDAATGDGDAAESFGIQWAFPTKQRLRETLLLLSNNGYRGFHRFLMNPSAPAARREVAWMAQLRREIVDRTVAAKAMPLKVAGQITAAQAIAAARASGRVRELLRGAQKVHATAEFSHRWNVWLVRFFSRDRGLGLASVSREGTVLEVAREEDKVQTSPSPR
jgi:hypothetical protein